MMVKSTDFKIYLQHLDARNFRPIFAICSNFTSP